MNVSGMALYAGAFAALSHALLLAQEPRRSEPQQRMEAAATRQRLSVSAMNTSIDRQRQSVSRQVRSDRGRVFQIDLPSPAPFPDPGSLACAPLSDSEVTSLVGAVSGREGIEPDLIRSVIRIESSFRPCAVSPKGALGLMQLMPATASALNVENPFDPYENVMGGGHFLKSLLERYGGDMAVALSAYNAGPGSVERAGGIPRIPETVNYLKQILPALASASSSPLF